MASPFPGMDPFLEADAYWPLLHHQWIIGLAEHMQSALDDHYRLRFGTRSYDLQLVLFTTIQKEKHRETFIEIRQRATDRLLTHLELISPANRLTDVGRRHYLEQREQTLAQQAQMVEMDFILRGEPLWPVEAPIVQEPHYAVAIHRPQRTRSEEVTSIPWREPLPRVRIPLASDDRDLSVDLQAVFERVYGRYFVDQVDYRADPPMPLAPADLDWIEQTLRSAGYRP